MPYVEFLSWCKYRNRYGSLHPGLRQDRTVAEFMRHYFNMKAGKKQFKFPDFSPYDEQVKTEETGTEDLGSVEEVFELLSGLAKGGS